MNNFSVQIADWEHDQKALKAIRHAVFVIEQKVPEELEWDDQDADAFHLLANNNNLEAIGTVRLLKTGQIGRMAVLNEYRSQGAGKLLMDAVLKLAVKNNFPSVFLHSQASAVTFYEAFGFTIISEEYEEAGIPHRKMKKSLVELKRPKFMPYK